MNDLVSYEPLIRIHGNVAGTELKNCAVWKRHLGRLLHRAMMLPRRIAVLKQEEAWAARDLEIGAFSARKVSEGRLHERQFAIKSRGTRRGQWLATFTLEDHSWLTSEMNGGQ